MAQKGQIIDIFVLEFSAFCFWLEFVPFGANLTHFVANSDIAVWFIHNADRVWRALEGKLGKKKS